MSKSSGTTITTAERETTRADGAVEGEQREGQSSGDVASDAQATRRPVQTSTKPAGGPNRARSGAANKGNRSSRQVREQGANKKDVAPPSADEDGKEEDEEDEKKATQDFWQFLVAGSYSSRKARGDWGGGDPGE